MTNTTLQLKNVSKHYAEPVLNNVNLTLDVGKSICVMAPSGKGKSTLLSIAGLLLAPTEGEVYLDGVETTALSDDVKSKLRSEKIGFLFQHTQLCGSLRAHENIALPASFNHSNKVSDIEKHVDEQLERFGLRDRKYYYPNQLSIGQKRRIACARALFLNPSLIIADEPTNDLDEDNKQVVINSLFEPVRASSSALLFATHDAEVAALADEVIRL